MVTVVVSADTAMFTILFPIRIALSILAGLDITLSRTIALLSPSSMSVFTLMWLTVVSAVSAEEKKAERHMRTTINAICKYRSVVKIVTSNDDFSHNYKI